MSGVFDALSSIILRITSECPTLAAVSSPSIISSMDDVLKHLPACYVSPGAAKPRPDTDKPALSIEDQEWIVMLVVGYPASSVSQPETTLGELVLQIIKALDNWHVPILHGKIRYTQRMPVEYEDGFAYIRLKFTHGYPIK